MSLYKNEWPGKCARLGQSRLGTGMICELIREYFTLYPPDGGEYEDAPGLPMLAWARGVWGKCYSRKYVKSHQTDT